MKPLVFAILAWVTALVSMAVALNSAFAIDSRKLTALLTPSYMMVNIGVVCGVHDQKLTTQKLGIYGTVWEYGQHIKLEVTEGLSQDKALTIKTAAADAAKEFILGIVDQLRNEAETNSNNAVHQWCQSFGWQIVRRTAGYHDERHEEFLAELRRAKPAAR